jgi:hypothetical protein
MSSLLSLPAILLIRGTRLKGDEVPMPCLTGDREARTLMVRLLGFIE